ncbi:MAG: hypothetical protein Q8O27_00730 [Enterobacteriaceae bacterium]|nr:hypothetical protein [Enterobacteriaceae bacterium]
MESGNATSYFQLTYEMLERFNLLKKVYYLATDGAPVMLGNGGL